MSSAPPSSLRRLTRTVGFRLAFGYSILLTISAGAILSVAYYALSVSLEHRDSESLREKFHDMESDALTSSLMQLRAESRFERKRGRRGPFFMRIIAASGEGMIYELGQLDWSRLEGMRRSRTPNDIILLPGRTEVEPTLEVISRAISPELILQVGKATDVREDTLQRFAAIAAGSMVLVLVLALGGGAYMAGRALRPVRHLLSTVQEVHGGSLRARVPVRGVGDEFDELGELFNTMIDRIESLVNGMRRALDNVAHDLRTPMTRLRGTAEIALNDGKPEAFGEALAECLEESDLVLEMLKTLMDISEAETGTMKLALERVDLGELLREAVGIYRYVAEDKGLRVRAETREPVVLNCDRNRMRQVISNLLDNAVKYSSPGGKIELRAFRRRSEAVIVVSDTGPGISADELPKIWDRLYRGDASRTERGLGLGLSLVKAVVAAHGGRVGVESLPGAGARFSATFPKDASPAPAPERPKIAGL